MRVLGVDFADGVARLGIGGISYCAGVEDNNSGGGGIFGLGAAAVKELALEGGAVGLGGAAAELLDVEGGHETKDSGKRIYTEFTEYTEGTVKRARNKSLAAVHAVDCG